MDTLAHRYILALAAQMGTDTSVPWEGIVWGCQAASWPPSAELTQNKV